MTWIYKLKSYNTERCDAYGKKWINSKCDGINTKGGSLCATKYIYDEKADGCFFGCLYDFRIKCIAFFDTVAKKE